MVNEGSLSRILTNFVIDDYRNQLIESSRINWKNNARLFVKDMDKPNMSSNEKSNSNDQLSDQAYHAPEGFIRDAAITIQGGGIYGFSMLGQLDYLINVKKINPVALSGSSAGAILATLIWAGYNPNDIKKKFQDLALENQHDGQSTNGNLTKLARLMGPTEETNHFKKDYELFIKLLDSIYNSFSHQTERSQLFEAKIPLINGMFNIIVVSVILVILMALASICYSDIVIGIDSKNKLAIPIIYIMMISLIIFSSLLLLIMACLLRATNPLRLVIKICAGLSKFSIEEIYRVIFVFILQNRGVFDGECLVETINDWLINSPLFIDHKTDLLSIMGDETLLKFRHIHELILETKRLRVPPLFLTATNITKSKLEVINSFSDDFKDLEIARVVRASAGFPGVFKPFRIINKKGKDHYIDGGIVSNFPHWVFLGDFRKMIGNSIFHEYHILSVSPWVEIGLRMGGENDEKSSGIDRSRLGDYINKFIKMSITVRNENDKIISNMNPRMKVIHQSYQNTGGPSASGMWRINDFHSGIIESMVCIGRQAAKNKIRPLSFKTPSSDTIHNLLKEVCEKASYLWQMENGGPEKFRACVYMPHRSSSSGNKNQLSLKMKIFYHYNMVNVQGDQDVDLTKVIEFSQGHTGRCFVHSKIMIGNIRKVIDVIQKGTEEQKQNLFNHYRTNAEFYDNINLNWVVCIPIFDPLRLYESKKSDKSKIDNDISSFYSELDLPLNGPVLGVLKLDANVNYDTAGSKTKGLPMKPEDQFKDSRVDTIISMLRVYNFKIGDILSRHFGSS